MFLFNNVLITMLFQLHKDKESTAIKLQKKRISITTINNVPNI